MRWDIIFSPPARREFDEAYDYYETEKEGLGEDFAKCVQHEIDHLKKNPKIHAKVYKDVRKAVVKRFPYCIYYLIVSDHVQLVSVFHSKRNPQIWQERVNGSD